MTRLKHLVSGEFNRLIKYNLFTASFVVALIWVVVGYFLDKDEFFEFLPFVFLMEASAMTALLIGAEMFFEKKEHTISSMLISPMKESEYIFAKILANVLNLFVMFGIIAGSVYFLKDLLFGFHWLAIGILLVTAYYVFIGILLSYISKDFTALLLNYMLMMIVLVFPTMMVQVGLLDASWADYLYWTPTDVTMRLMTASIADSVNLVDYLIDCVYVIALSFVMYRFLVLPYFKDFATKDLGV